MDACLDNTLSTLQTFSKLALSLLQAHTLRKIVSHRDCSWQLGGDRDSKIALRTPWKCLLKSSNFRAKIIQRKLPSICRLFSLKCCIFFFIQLWLLINLHFSCSLQIQQYQPYSWPKGASKCYDNMIAYNHTFWIKKKPSMMTENVAAASILIIWKKFHAVHSNNILSR